MNPATSATPVNVEMRDGMQAFDRMAELLLAGVVTGFSWGSPRAELDLAGDCADAGDRLREPLGHGRRRQTIAPGPSFALAQLEIYNRVERLSSSRRKKCGLRQQSNTPVAAGQPLCKNYTL
jgi:hypothetical protein